MKQQGIYYERDDPSESYSVIFLNIAQNTQDISEVRNQLYALWQIYEDLKIGKGRELPNPPNGPKDFTFLIGYSRKLFQSIKQNSILPSGFRVRDRLPNFNNPGGNGPVNIWENSGFAFSEGVSTNRADADIVIQFISDKESETKRAVLETWKYLEDKSLLNLSGYYSGFQRTDNRNMLDFLDGISNLPPGDREKSIFNDGTYI